MASYRLNKFCLIWVLFFALLIPAVSLGDQQTGAIINNFDIQPREFSGASLSGTMSLQITIYPAAFRSFCNDSSLTTVRIGFYKSVTGADPLVGGAYPFPNDSFSASQTSVVITKSKNITGSDALDAGEYYVNVECPNSLLFSQATASGNITISHSAIYACAGPGASGNIYYCSHDNKPDCSDTACTAASKQNCAVVTNSQCGHAVSAGTGTGTTGTGTGTGTGSPSNPASGSTQTYVFNVPNWLAGGPDSITGLINLITTWLFNIAIPIAVIFIIWAGVLYLTAGAKPANVKKAGDIMKYVALGLSIIFIGKGFITLIESVLQMGGTGATNNAAAPGNPGTGSNPGAGNYAAGNIGTICGGSNGNCLAGLECKNTVCQKNGGNTQNEPCLSGANCASGLVCNPNSRVTINNRQLGTCQPTNQ